MRHGVIADHAASCTGCVAGLTALAAYIGVLFLLRGGGPLVPIVTLAVVLQLLPLLGPTLLSCDAYTYWAYGRVGAAHEANPYEDAPARWPDDPATVHMGSSWREQPSLYGPVFTLLSERVADVAGGRRAARLASSAELPCFRSWRSSGSPRCLPTTEPSRPRSSD